eukprot:1867425-Prymnesium_polylepis.2
MVNDILWLHRSYYTSDGVYTEGVVGLSGCTFDLAQHVRRCVTLNPAPRPVYIELFRRSKQDA